jgi:hypothetical protein
MNRKFQVVQLNVGKQQMVQQSLMNDTGLQDTAVLAIQEPRAKRIEEKLVTTPMMHHKWTKMVPSEEKESRWPI